MSKFKIGLSVLALGLAALQPLRAEGSLGLTGNDPTESAATRAGARPRSSSHKADPDDVDETQALFDALASETRSLDRPRLEPLFQSLTDEYHLGDYSGKARKALGEAESVLNVQDAIATQDSRAKDLSVITTKDDVAKAQALAEDLKASGADLHKTVKQIQDKASEDEVRDLRNWLMISEGLLRRRREDAPARSPSTQALSPSAATPLSAAGISPSAEALSPSATVAP